MERQMALILTFLGKGGVGKTTIAIAAAKRLARQGQRVLFATQDASPAFAHILGQPIAPSTAPNQPQSIDANLDLVQFQVAHLLETGWETVKQLEAQYVRTPFFKNVYGQELGLLPGMSSALVMNEIRRYESQYDAIILDGNGDSETLRMLGAPEVVSWYVRRFRAVFGESDLARTITPFLAPLTAAVLTVNLTADNFAQPTQELNQLLDQGKAILSDPRRAAAYLVTTADPAAIAQAQYLWGSAQQIGLTVGGVLLNQTTDIPGFEPLTANAIPHRDSNSWDALIAALPDFSQAAQAPRPIVIDSANRQVSLFLPGFTKQQVKLTQSGPEVTIEAGDQRSNIFLPPDLAGRPVSGAKFQDSYLIITFQ
jgi:anion-transporting  ArsA/GET3 family ATPase